MTDEEMMIDLNDQSSIIPFQIPATQETMLSQEDNQSMDIFGNSQSLLNQSIEEQTNQTENNSISNLDPYAPTSSQNVSQSQELFRISQSPIIHSKNKAKNIPNIQETAGGRNTPPLFQTKIDQHLRAVGSKSRPFSYTFKNNKGDGKPKRNRFLTDSHLSDTEGDSSSDDEISDSDYPVFGNTNENEQTPKQPRTKLVPKRQLPNRAANDIEKKERKAQRKKENQAVSQLKECVEKNETISNTNMNIILQKLVDQVSDLSKNQENTGKTIEKTIQNCVQSSVTQSLSNLTTRFKHLETDVSKLKTAEETNKITRKDVEKHKTEIEDLSKAMNDLTRKDTERDSVIEKLTARLTKLESTKGSGQENNSALAWNNYLSLQNNGTENYIIVGFKDKKKKISSDAEAQAALNAINHEIVKIAMQNGTTLDLKDIKGKKHESKSDIIIVMLESWTRKMDYERLLQTLPPSYQIWKDKYVPAQYSEAYRTYKNVAFDIRQSGKYKVRIIIENNWMKLQTQKKSSDKKYVWDQVPNMVFYPPVPGSEEHKIQKERIQSFRNDKEFETETMTNNGDYEKMQKTVCIATIKENVIPLLVTDKHRDSFKKLIFSKLTSNPNPLTVTALHWTDKSFQVEFQTLDMAWKSLASLNHIQIPWKGIDGKSESTILYTRCSLLGYKQPRTMEVRKNSFIVSESLVNI